MQIFHTRRLAVRRGRGEGRDCRASLAQKIKPTHYRFVNMTHARVMGFNGGLKKQSIFFKEGSDATQPFPL